MKIYEKISDWLVPVLLSGVLYYLQSIASEVQKMSTNLAVTVSQVDFHEKRLEKHDARIDRLNDDVQTLFAAATRRQAPR